MTESTIVCILGMHRSGTSVLSRLLNILGVYLGKEDSLAQPMACNPKGFWEHTVLQEINEKILAKAGGSWHTPPNLPSGWEYGPSLENLVTCAKNVIHDDFAKARIWGFKDPRTCLTLPFWQRLLPSIRYIVCVRHPMEVAWSLNRRDGFSIEKGIYLWLAYLKAILQHTAGEDRLIVLYEELIGNWQLQIQRLSKFLGIPKQVNLRYLLENVGSFIDKDLRHHLSKPFTTDGDSSTLPLSRSLIIAEKIYNISKRHQPSQLDTMTEQLELALDILRPVVRAQEAEKNRRDLESWNRKSRLLLQDIESIIPSDNVFILVDGALLERKGILTTCLVLPFLERNGEYWGAPPDDETAIQEVRRLRQAAANFMVFAWPAFWWLDHYQGLTNYLDLNHRCLLKNDRVVIFDLH